MKMRLEMKRRWKNHMSEWKNEMKKKENMISLRDWRLCMNDIDL